MKELKEGRVLKSTGSWYILEDKDGQTLQARLRGKVKLLDLQVTNPIAVGDWVRYTLEEGQESLGFIHEVMPRENYLIRKAVKKKSAAHLLATNIDQAILLVTLQYPRTSLGFIDRFLVSCETFRIPAVLLFNKSDLWSEEEKEEVSFLRMAYKSLGYATLSHSLFSEDEKQSLAGLLSGKLSVVSGHSGVGKSSLLNSLSPGLGLATKEVSSFANKGVHTTTFAEMHEIAEETYIIDTPGIKELGLAEVEKEELAHYFPEFRSRLNTCKFHNCLHVEEPGCAIKAAVEEGDIWESRYYNYLSMLSGEDNRG